MTYLEEEGGYLPEMRYWAQWGHNFNRVGYNDSREEFVQEVPEGSARQEAYEAIVSLPDMPEAKGYKQSLQPLDDGTIQRVITGGEIPGHGRPEIVTVGTEQPPEVRLVAYRWRRSGAGPLKG